MIAFAKPLNAWHITSGRLGHALCGLAGDNLRITTPELIGARDQTVCPDCWQEFFTGRLIAPHFWYQEDVHVATTKPRTQAASRRTKNPSVRGSNASTGKNGRLPHIPADEIPALIRRQREELGLTIRAAAAAAGISGAAWHNVEQSRRSVRPETIRAMLAAVGLTAEGPFYVVRGPGKKISAKIAGGC